MFKYRMKKYLHINVYHIVSNYFSENHLTTFYVTNDKTHKTVQRQINIHYCLLKKLNGLYCKNYAFPRLLRLQWPVHLYYIG